MAVIKVNLDNFAEEVLRSEKPVLLDMYADWCGPCQMMAPELEAFAEENDSVKVCKLNVDGFACCGTIPFYRSVSRRSSFRSFSSVMACGELSRVRRFGSVCNACFGYSLRDRLYGDAWR